MENGRAASSKLSDTGRTPSTLRSFSVNKQKVIGDDPLSSLFSSKVQLQRTKQGLKDFSKSANKFCIAGVGIDVDDERPNENLGHCPSAYSQNSQPSKYDFKYFTMPGSRQPSPSSDNGSFAKEKILKSSKNFSMDQDYSPNGGLTETLIGLSNIGLIHDTDSIKKEPLRTKIPDRSFTMKPRSISLSSHNSRKSMRSGQLVSTVSEPGDISLAMSSTTFPISDLSENLGLARVQENRNFKKCHIQMTDGNTESKPLPVDIKNSASLQIEESSGKNSYHGASEKLKFPHLDHFTNIQKARDLVDHAREHILKTHKILGSNVNETVEPVSPLANPKHLVHNSPSSLLPDQYSSPSSIKLCESSVPGTEISKSRVIKTDFPPLKNRFDSNYSRKISTDEIVRQPAFKHKIFISPVFTFDSELEIASPSLSASEQVLDVEVALGAKRVDNKKPLISRVSDKYKLVPAQEFSTNLMTSPASNNKYASKADNSISEKPFLEETSRYLYKPSLTSQVESWSDITGSHYQSSIDRVDTKRADRRGNISPKRTMKWLRDLISSSGPYESQLTALPRRTTPSRNVKNLIPNTNLESKSFKNKSSKIKYGQGDDFAGTGLANTINTLEQLVDEALSIAQQAAENQDLANSPSFLSSASKFLKGSRADIKKYLKKSSNPSSTYESFRSSPESSESYQNDECESFDPVEEEKLSRAPIEVVSRPILESSQPPVRIIAPANMVTSRSPKQMKQNDLQSQSAGNSEYLLKRRRATSFRGKSMNSIKGRKKTSRNNTYRFRIKSSSPDSTHDAKDFSARLPPFSFLNKITSIPVYYDSAEGRGNIPPEIVDIQKNYTHKNLKPGSLEADTQNFINDYLEDASKNDIKARVPEIQDLKISDQTARYSLDSSSASNYNEIGVDTESGMRSHARDKISKPSTPANDNTLLENTGSNSSELNRPNKKTEADEFKSNVSQSKEFIPEKVEKKQIIARDWPSRKKRPVAAVACLSTALVGILAGIYAGETPAIQYYIVDFHHYTVLGNVVFFFGLAIPTFFVWPLPLIHGRKPYILGSMSIAMPLLFPQALAVGVFRSPYVARWRVGLLLSRALMGFCLGFANMNFKSMLTDLFGASLQSSNPYQEHVDKFDVRRHGGGMGIWLGLWTWSALGSIGIGFLIGAAIIETLPPSWGFYISIIIIAFVMLLNAVCPELRRSAFKKTVAEVVTKDLVTRRSIGGDLNLNIAKSGPKWWREELYYGISLSQKMIRQPGFLILSLYVAWIYGQQVLIIVLVGALMSKKYHFRSPMVGLSVMAIPIGALLAVPFQKASLFSRTRRRLSIVDDSIFSKKKIQWSSHMLRRGIFVLCLPIFGLVYTLLSSGPPIPFILPIIAAGFIGFLSNLAMAECNGIIMETFDTSDLQPGMTGRPRGPSGERTAMRRTNYSSFPRVCSAFAIVETFGYVLAAGTSGISGVLTRRLGQQAATGVMAGILLVLSILLLGVLARYTEVQIIPDSKMEQMNNYHQARWASQMRREAGLDEDEEPWRPVIIGNPHKSTRKVSLLELGSLSRYSEIRIKNRLIDETSLEARHPNRNAINALEREIRRNMRRSPSQSSRDSKRHDIPGQSNPGRRKDMKSVRREIKNASDHKYKDIKGERRISE